MAQAASEFRPPRTERAGSRTCASGSRQAMIARTRKALPVLLALARSFDAVQRSGPRSCFRAAGRSAARCQRADPNRRPVRAAAAGFWFWTIRSRAVAGLRAVEDAGHGIVVARRDRVELVIVAAGAGHGQAEEGLRGRVDLLVRQVHLELQRRSARRAAWARSPGSPSRSSGSARCAGSAAGSRSPAICSLMNRLNGLSALKAAMT